MTTQDAPGRKQPANADSPAGTDPTSALPAGSPLDSAEAALGVEHKQVTLPVPRWLGPLAVACAVGIIPWIVYLALTLPARQRAVDYDVAWVGYDAAMAAVLAALAYCAQRRKTATGPVAAVAATLLLVDAWFDIVTTQGGQQLAFAIASAVLLEIPLAILCIWVAVNAERVRERAYLTLHARWQRAVGIGRDRGDARRSVSDPPGPAPQR